MGILPNRIPYTIHKKIPLVIMTYIPREISLTCFVLSILMICGKNATVVHIPAISPTSSMHIYGIKSPSCFCSNVHYSAPFINTKPISKKTTSQVSGSSPGTTTNLVG